MQHFEISVDEAGNGCRQSARRKSGLGGGPHKHGGQFADWLSLAQVPCRIGPGEG